MTQKHKHYDAIVAWAEGKRIQYRRAGGVWLDTGVPSFYAHYEYRVKPEVLRYRVALIGFADAGGPDVATARSEYDARKFEQFSTFIRWLTDWQEVEV